MFDYISNMFFKNSGKRIQNIAIILFFIQVIFAAIGGIVMFFAGLIDIDDMGGLCLLSPFAVFLAIGAAWLDSIFIYGFGELIENTSKDYSTLAPSQPTTPRSSPKKQSTLHRCAICKKPTQDDICPDCIKRKEEYEKNISDHFLNK